LLLRPTGTETLATAMWSHTEVAAYSQAAPYAAMLVVVAAIPAFVLSRSFGWGAGGRRDPGTATAAPGRANETKRSAT